MRPISQKYAPRTLRRDIPLSLYIRAPLNTRDSYSWQPKQQCEIPQVLFLGGCEGRGWLARGV